MNNTTNKDVLKSKISDLTLEHWAKFKSPLLLSQIGPKIGISAVENRRAIEPLNLSKFIQFYCSDLVKIVKHPKSSVKIGCIPTSVDVGSDEISLADLFDRVNTATHSLQFQAPVWTAFTKAIPSGKKRYIDISNAQITFSDSHGNAGEDNLKEVLLSDLVEGYDNSEENKARVNSNIEKWANRYNVKIESLSVKALHRSAGKDSPLDLFLNTFTNEELARISMPLDLIKKIRFC